MTQSKVGDACIKIISQEQSRYELWTEELAAQQIETKKFDQMTKKQDQLLFSKLIPFSFILVTFHILLNLSEDLSVEIKMVKRDIIPSLLVLMNRKPTELILLALTFLKKLSVFEENKTLILQVI